ncbi:putative membrane protein, predicted efflux pump [Handroanthus impetiginosus]|uniref:Putative membrane protein, predicted efflux pump n=1 Tax=Handroanthus impetiginosus TaxID=429701 RepID=A0A2G9IAL7_9LAMI|nr:putative membrane protein, predicted efflux pump [Handroanthus impetiginosus]
MESVEPALVPENDERKGDFRTKREAFVREANKVSSIAVPMIVVSVSQYLLRAAPMMMLGHLGELALSSASIAISVSNVTGFSLLKNFKPSEQTGLASALETLCGQAYGAQQYQKVGIFTYGAIIWLFLAYKLLILIGQDPVISKEAGKFSVWLIPSLFPYAIFQILVRYFQTQSLIIPMLFSSIVTLSIHLPLTWALIFKLKLGNVGAAISIGFSYLLNVILLALYVKCSSICKKTLAPFSKDVFLTMREFFRFAIPSAVMICLEWWTFEIVILLGGLLPNPRLETSVLSICTRVSNELGAGKPQAAQLVLSTVLVLTIVEFLIAATVIFICRYILGYSFSNDKSIVYYVKSMAPFLCVSIVMDSLQTVLSGKGLWSGLIAGATVQSILLVIVTFRTDWEKKLMAALNNPLLIESKPRNFRGGTVKRRGAST